MEKLQCRRCQHIWIPRVQEVKECPKCKSRIWFKPLSFDEIFEKFVKNKENQKK